MRTMYRIRDIEWKKRELALELGMLEREQSHLSTKVSERPLTSWEMERVKEIILEHKKVISELKNFDSLLAA